MTPRTKTAKRHQLVTETQRRGWRSGSSVQHTTRSNRLPAICLALACAFFVSTVGRADAAPSSGSARAQTIPLLRVGFQNRITTLDQFRFAGNSQIFCALGLETLVKIAPDGSLKPNLAVRVTQPGRAVYVYHLRKGVKFWDGSELTADDVANSLNYLRFPGAIPRYLTGIIKDVAVVDKYTVRVTLRRIDASFQWVPASSQVPIFQKKFQDEHKEEMGRPGVLIMGTGPWKFDSLDPNKGLELSANPNYWGGKVAIQRISVKFFSDETSMALAFRAGELDVVPYIRDGRAFESASGSNLLSKPGLETFVLSFPTQVAPWSDVHVRRAVAYALVKQDILNARGGYATPIDTLIAPDLLRGIASKSQISTLMRSLPLYRFSIAKAKQELAKSAYPNGFSADLQVLGAPPFTTMAQVIVAQLQQIGIKLDLKPVPGGQFLALLFGDKNKIGAFLLNPTPSLPDPNFITSLILGSKKATGTGLNIANYTPPAVDDLITKGIAVVDPVKRWSIYSALLKRLGNDVPYAPLFVTNRVAAITSKFSWPTFDGYYLQRAWPLELKTR